MAVRPEFGGRPACPRLRSPCDRLRQALLFEGAGLLLVSPLFAWATGGTLASAFGLLVVLSVIALAWNALFNATFDACEAKLTGRRADRRPAWWRVLHAWAFECGLVVLTLPVVVRWYGMGWFAALIADLGLSLVYVVYAFFFHLCYDRCFPLRPD